MIINRNVPPVFQSSSFTPVYVSAQCDPRTGFLCGSQCVFCDASVGFVANLDSCNCSCPAGMILCIAV